MTNEKSELLVRTSDVHFSFSHLAENPCQVSKDFRLRARQEIRCAFWRERRAGRCEAPRRRRCRCASSRSGNKADARPPPRPPGLLAPRPAGGVARSVHAAPGMLGARALAA